MFFFRFSRGSAREGDRRAANQWDARNEVSRLQSRVWSFACLARFARRTKKKERLLVVYFVRPSICPAEPTWVFQPIVCWSVGNNVLYVLFSLQDSFNGCSRQWIRGLCQPVTQWRRQYVSLGYVSSKCSSQSCKQQQDLYNITFLTSFFRNCFVQKIRVVWFHPVCVQTPPPLRFFLSGGRGVVCTQARFHPFGLSG